MTQILSSIFKLKWTFSGGNNDFLWFLEYLIARENFDVIQQNWLSNMSTKFYKPSLLIELGIYPTQLTSTTDKYLRTRKGSRLLWMWGRVCGTGLVERISRRCRYLSSSNVLTELKLFISVNFFRVYNRQMQKNKNFDSGSIFDMCFRLGKTRLHEICQIYRPKNATLPPILSFIL